MRTWYMLFQNPISVIHRKAPETLRRFTRVDIISNWLQRQSHAILHTQKEVNRFTEHSYFQLSCVQLFIVLGYIFREFSFACNMPSTEKRRSILCWRRASLVFVMVLKLCGSEECEYIFHICVILFDFARKWARVSRLTGESFQL